MRVNSPFRNMSPPLRFFRHKIVNLYKRTLRTYERNFRAYVAKRVFNLEMYIYINIDNINASLSLRVFPYLSYIKSEKLKLKYPLYRLILFSGV